VVSIAIVSPELGLGSLLSGPPATEGIGSGSKIAPPEAPQTFSALIPHTANANKSERMLSDRAIGLGSC
jgi:hypothetical protein